MRRHELVEKRNAFDWKSQRKPEYLKALERLLEKKSGFANKEDLTKLAEQFDVPFAVVETDFERF